MGSFTLMLSFLFITKVQWHNAYATDNAEPISHSALLFVVKGFVFFQISQDILLPKVLLCDNRGLETHLKE